ncbi:MAG: Trk system potassium transporter TrkA [Candidatus Hydrogenedentes bacterium]|nr:Trk system potassium transporter TrkA [Candidatus Hydrogenedentota bacterium]
MNIFIAGGGRVGFHLARLLSAEKHDVTVIESDRAQLEHIDYSLDVSTVAGNMLDVILLKSSGVGDADLFLAATGDDETNLIAATTAKGLGAKQVVARVHNSIFIESDILYETIMGIDYIISPQALTALDIAAYIENPGLVASESFARGLVKMRQIRAARVPLATGQTLKDISLPDGVLIGAISRNGSVEIPHGDSTIEVHDLVTLLGRKESVAEAQKLFQGTETKYRSIAIMGGSSVGVHLAQILEKRGLTVKLFDRDLSRCHELAAILERTKVVCRDAALRISLEQEHIDDADIFVSATGDDERNIMAAVLAKEVGVKETLAVVHQPDFAPLVAKLGIDHAVTPRACIANRILKLANQGQDTSLAVMEEGQIDILEYDIRSSNPIIGARLADIKFPRDSLVASILRGEEVIVPKGEDMIQAGDTVIVIATDKSVDQVRKMFNP